MIQFNYTNTSTGVVVENALAWVANTNIDGTRVTMSGNVQISSPLILPNYIPFIDVQTYTGVPYDPTSNDSPASQFYQWLMANVPMYENGSIYIPVVE